MWSKSCPKTLFILVLAVSALGFPAASRAEEVWMLRGGTTTIALDAGIVERLGLKIGDADPKTSPTGGQPGPWVFPVNPESTLTFSVWDGSAPQFLGGQVLHFGSLWVAAAPKQHNLSDWFVEPLDGRSFDRLRLSDAGAGKDGGFVLERIKVGFDRAARTLTIHGAELHLSPAWAAALGDPGLANHALGTLTVQGMAEWIGGTPPEPEPVGPSLPQTRDIGPDMTFCQLYDLAQYGRVGDLVGLAVATTSWNVGDHDVMWFPIPNEDHPFIVMNLFRAKNDRFEQIGQSWIKHGFYALGNTQCGGTCTYESGHGAGNWLGVGCTDTYSSPLNAAQNGLGPRYEVNPWTGAWTYAGSHNSQGSHSHDGVQHRVEVHDADLDPAQNAGATYYGESFYAIKDDVKAMNSASWKPATVSGSPGGTWSFGVSGSGTPPNIGFAIDAWTGARKTTIAQEVPPIEFVSPDGRCVLAAKATDIGGGMWHYEYALLNVDMDRQVGSFSIPLPGGSIVSHVGFHAVEHHDEPFNAPGGVPIDNAPWTAAVTGAAVTWSTTTNPLRWDTLYNFRFDADSAPGDVAAALGLFKPGTPTSLTGTTTGPSGPPPVCGDGVVQGTEECDPPDGVHCDANCQWICGDGVVQPGEYCDPPNGTTCDANCQRIPVCGDGFLDAGEECDPPDGVHCDAACQWVCGDGVVQPGEYCDPPNGTTCDANCQRIPTCGDGIVDPGEECDPPDGLTCDANCHLLSNDLCAGAFPICPGVYSGSTTGANNDGSASCGSSATSPDVWYSYTPVAGGTLTLKTCGAGNYDTVISVHTGCPGTTSNQHACMDDGCPEPGYKTNLSTTVTGGVHYWIRMSGYSNASGNFVLTLTGPDCESGAECGNGIVEPGEQCDPPNGTTCDANCQRIPTCGDGFVDAGEECDPPNGTTCDANCQRIPVCGDGFIDGSEECDDGNTTPGDGCDENCQLEPNGANDCADALPITDGAYFFDTGGATTDGPDEPVACNFSGYTQVGADIWYCYTAPAWGDLTVSTCNAATYDSKIAVYEGCTCPPTTILGCNDDTTGCGTTSRVTVPVGANRQYLIRVGGYNAATGTGTLSVTDVPTVYGDDLRGGRIVGRVVLTA